MKSWATATVCLFFMVGCQSSQPHPGSELANSRSGSDFTLLAFSMVWLNTGVNTPKSEWTPGARFDERRNPRVTCFDDAESQAVECSTRKVKTKDAGSFKCTLGLECVQESTGKTIDAQTVRYLSLIQSGQVAALNDELKGQGLKEIRCREVSKPDGSKKCLPLARVVQFESDSYAMSCVQGFVQQYQCRLARK